MTLNDLYLREFVNLNHRVTVTTFNLFIIIAVMIAFMGGVMNFSVISVNGGRMPVYNTDIPLNPSTHFSSTDKSEVNKFYFTDIIKLPGAIFSIGDFFLIFGFSLILS